MDHSALTYARHFRRMNNNRGSALFVNFTTKHTVRTEQREASDAVVNRALDILRPAQGCELRDLVWPK